MGEVLKFKNKADRRIALALLHWAWWLIKHRDSYTVCPAVSLAASELQATCTSPSKHERIRRVRDQLNIRISTAIGDHAYVTGWLDEHCAEYRDWRTAVQGNYVGEASMRGFRKVHEYRMGWIDSMISSIEKDGCI